MKVNLNIDGKPVQTDQGRTVLQAALEAGIYIPNLCYHPDLPPAGACRLCLVEIEGMRGLLTSCTTAVREGMQVHTDTEQLKEMRRHIIWLILSERPVPPDKSSQLRKVVDWIGVENPLPGYEPEPRHIPPRPDPVLFGRDQGLCILCGRCVRMCKGIKGVGGIGFVNRGADTVVSTSYDVSLKDAACKFCGSCVEVCPAGALYDIKKAEEGDERMKTIVPCQSTCPAEIDIPRFIGLIAEGRFQDAIAVVWERSPFALVLGCVCTHLCESVCKRCEVNEPVAIRELKRFVAERDTGEWLSRVRIAPSTGRKVAIIGSGPAGLTCAWFLARLGHTVTVYESQKKPGGMMRSCIPAYRLPEEVLDREIGHIESIGVKILTSTPVESIDALLDQGADAVFVALGTPSGMKLGIEGEDDPRVADGISLLQAIKTGRNSGVHGTVAVVGGGNVAIDVARSALRLGADKVIILYRRTRDEMPASSEEIDYAIEEGVEIQYLTAPQQLEPEPDTLKIQCIRMELGEPDASGRRRPVPIKDSEFIVTADLLVTAIGQQLALPQGFGIDQDKKGRLKVDQTTLESSRPGVFAGGDSVTGPATVIEAIQSGRKAAASIDIHLGGKGEIDQELVPRESDNMWIGREEGFADRQRARTPVLPVSKRLKGNPEVEQAFDEQTAIEEAKRCLKCALRLKIASAPLPPTC